MALVEEEQEAGVPEWVVTFGDMMSLLLTFFVMLLSMSEMKIDRSQAVMEALQDQFGNSDASVSFMPGPAPPSSSAINRYPSLGRARRAHTMSGGDKVRAPVGDYARVTTIRPTKDPTLGGMVYFDEGSSRLSTEHRKTLQAIGQVIRGKLQKISIKGHTSLRPLPPDSPHRNHWDLAYARCSVVTEYLVRLGVDPKRISMGVVGDNEPVHTGYDPLLRKRNARVEVFLLPTLMDGKKSPEEKGGSTSPQEAEAKEGGVEEKRVQERKTDEANPAEGAAEPAIESDAG